MFAIGQYIFYLLIKLSIVKRRYTSPYWQTLPSYPLEQKHVLFRMQMPACLHGGSQVALGSKMKGTATPRGESDLAAQTLTISAPQIRIRDNLIKVVVE